MRAATGRGGAEGGCGESDRGDGEARGGCHHLADLCRHVLGGHLWEEDAYKARRTRFNPCHHASRECGGAAMGVATGRGAAVVAAYRVGLRR